MEMGLMSYVHSLLLRKGRLIDLLPCKDDLAKGEMPEIEAARADIEARVAEEKEINKEVAAAIVKLRELDKRNHYGESLRRAFGGK